MILKILYVIGCVVEGAVHSSMHLEDEEDVVSLLQLWKGILGPPKKKQEDKENQDPEKKEEDGVITIDPKENEHFGKAKGYTEESWASHLSSLFGNPDSPTKIIVTGWNDKQKPKLGVRIRIEQALDDFEYFIEVYITEHVNKKYKKHLATIYKERKDTWDELVKQYWPTPHGPIFIQLKFSSEQVSIAELVSFNHETGFKKGISFHRFHTFFALKFLFYGFDL